jgi:hypothetical protein
MSGWSPGHDGHEEDEVGSRRSVVLALTGCLAIAAVALGVGGALAQQDGEAPTASPAEEELVERLGALEAQLPGTIVPTAVQIDDEETWGSLEGDPAGVNAILDTVEGELRSLFIDADDASGEIADAVALVARGWLDIWHGTEELALADSHDLAFPLDADVDGVATDADELRGRIHAGLRMILQGQQRLLDGYTVLREAPGPADVQATFDSRAVAAEDFDADLRPQIHVMISERSTSVWVAVERFETDAPGIDPRAMSLEIVCIDREALREAGGIVTPELLPELVAATPERADCPDLPEGGDPLDLDD